MPYSRVPEVNRAALLGMRTVGGGRNALTKLCGFLDLPPPVTSNSYTDHVKSLMKETETLTEANMKTASDELRANIFEMNSTEADGSVQTEEILDCAVTVDGSWAHRGFSSRHGFVSVMSVLTGKVLDYVFLTSECSGCKVWENNGKEGTFEHMEWSIEHKKDCTITHDGSAKAMEERGAVILFKRSIQRNKLRYTAYVGDGDSSAYAGVVAAKPYGEIPITKEDCVRHIQKRMGTHLRKLLENHEGMSIYV